MRLLLFLSTKKRYISGLRNITILSTCKSLFLFTKKILPFASPVIIMNKILTVLVDGIVGQVHANIILQGKGWSDREKLS